MANALEPLALVIRGYERQTKPSVTVDSIELFVFRMYQMPLTVYSRSMGILYDTPDYVRTLQWLGRSLQVGRESVLLRSAPQGLVDARGSWPYQSLPSVELIERLGHLRQPLSLTCVLSPDVSDSAIEDFHTGMPSPLVPLFVPLKTHLCHRADGMPAWQHYSARTRRRLNLAAESFVVTRKLFPDVHNVVSTWQNQLRHRRRIPTMSSPDHAHFQGLFELARRSEDVACFFLRWRHSGDYCGVFLACRDEMKGSWHAHTALVDDQARSAFGMYLLFDSVLKTLAGSDLWLGGAPSGPNGMGVYRFKQRFANDHATAKLLYVELNSRAANRVRAQYGTFAFTPDYRNPDVELLYESNEPHVAS